MMKFLRLALATLVMGLAVIPAANARDSFSIGLNFGGGYPYYAPAAQYYPAPPVVYYGQPSYYAAPPAYYYPQTSFAYYGYGGGHRGHHRGHHGWNRGGHDGGGGHGRRHHGRGHHDDDD